MASRVSGLGKEPVFREGIWSEASHSVCPTSHESGNGKELTFSLLPTAAGNIGMDNLCTDNIKKW